MKKLMFRLSLLAFTTSIAFLLVWCFNLIGGIAAILFVVGEIEGGES